ncbi:DNA repair protein RecO [Calditrichota bacterium LG25]
MSELIKSKALVLQSIRWHETSKIVTLYTKELGLIKAIARGVYRKNSVLAGRLETLNLVQVVIAQKETRDLQIITSADLLDPFSELKADLKRLPYALAIMEMIQKVLQAGQKDEIFFDFLEQMIRSVSLARQPLIVFWYFLLKFSSYLGFKPDFSVCFFCHKKNFKQGAFFLLKKGGLVCMACADSSFQNLKLNENDISFLQRLQQYPYRRIHELTTDFGFSVDFTAMLLQYLNIHVGQRLKLESLNLIG